MTTVQPPSAGSPSTLLRQTSDLAEVLTGYASSVACSEASSDHVPSLPDAEADESIRLILREGETATVQAVLKESGAAPNDFERVSNLLLDKEVSAEVLLDSQLGPDSAKRSFEDGLSLDLAQAVETLTRAKMDWTSSNVEKLDKEWSEAPRGFHEAVSNFVQLDVVGAILARAEAGTQASGVFADLEGHLEKDIEDAENAMGQLEVMTTKAATVKIICQLDIVLVKALLGGLQKSGLSAGEFRWMVLMRECCKSIVEL